jgi:hypothetical protein
MEFSQLTLVQHVRSETFVVCLSCYLSGNTPEDLFIKVNIFVF